MSRPHRVFAPGAGTHITARIQGKAALFTEPLRDQVAATICQAAKFCGTNVLALVVMPNHFHIVVQQGRYPLGWMMQRAMQQTALIVKRTYGNDGHVFGARYWSCICSGPRYLRQAIIYTHLNPWKIDLCCEPEDYAWSSAAAFYRPADMRPWAREVAVEKALLLFADNSFDKSDMLANYRAHIEYWKTRYKTMLPGDYLLFDPLPDPRRPGAAKGDEYWSMEYAHVVPQEQRVVDSQDISERAADILRTIEPDCTLDILRAAGRSKAAARPRRELTAALLARGHRNRAISRCLFVSPAYVSSVARMVRDRRPPD
ncbi:MAG: transposase [Gemmatimonadota bacterium]